MRHVNFNASPICKRWDTAFADRCLHVGFSIRFMHPRHYMHLLLLNGRVTETERYVLEASYAAVYIARNAYSMFCTVTQCTNFRNWVFCNSLRITTFHFILVVRVRCTQHGIGDYRRVESYNSGYGKWKNISVSLYLPSKWLVKTSHVF